MLWWLFAPAGRALTLVVVVAIVVAAARVKKRRHRRQPRARPARRDLRRARGAEDN
jgi:hypothetical protein